MPVVDARRALLDDWTNGKPGWDYEAVLRDNDVTVVWEDTVTADGITFTKAPQHMCGWSLSWKYGCISLGNTTERIAREAAATFVRLWQLGVSASFSSTLVQGYIDQLARGADEVSQDKSHS